MCRGISASETILTGHDAMSLRQYSLVPPDHTCRWRRGQWRGDQEAKLPGAVVDPNFVCCFGFVCVFVFCFFVWCFGFCVLLCCFVFVFCFVFFGFFFLF